MKGVQQAQRLHVVCNRDIRFQQPSEARHCLDGGMRSPRRGTQPLQDAGRLGGQGRARRKQRGLRKLRLPGSFLGALAGQGHGGLGGHGFAQQVALDAIGAGRISMHFGNLSKAL